MSLPLISAKCITYGRVDTLEESLHSFLQQTYPNKEMIIINDYPLQKLQFDHPQVKIVNLDETFNTIGSKENFATNLCEGEIICQWDDDDVALPNHMDNVAEHLTPDVDIIHWKTGVYCEDQSAIKEVGWIGNSGIAKFVEMPIEKASWFYMWGGRSYHMSGEGYDKPGKANVIQRHSLHIANLKQQGKIPTGDVQLKPHWKKDYIQMLKDFNASRVHNSNLS